MTRPGPGPFGDIRLLRNHWAGPAGPRAYYWYLTFACDAAVCDLATRSQQALAFPYYDPVPPQGLHMTLDRIAPEGVCHDVGGAAIGACGLDVPHRA
ncbi:MAG TPA: hypothetical protein VG142_06675 [Trebonia sp.]|nr:hypothetical protein [Trebonia sp.]